MVSDYIIKELNYNVTDVSIACDDEQIEAHKIFEESCNRYRLPATDSDMLLQIQGFCYRFKHSVTDSGIMLQKKHFCFQSISIPEGWLVKEEESQHGKQFQVRVNNSTTLG